MTSRHGTRSGVGHRELLKSWGRGKALGANPKGFYSEIVNPEAKGRVTVRSCAAVLGTATALCPYQLSGAELDDRGVLI